MTRMEYDVEPTAIVVGTSLGTAEYLTHLALYYGVAGLILRTEP